MVAAPHSRSTLVSERPHSSGWLPPRRIDTTNRHTANSAPPSAPGNHLQGQSHPGSVDVYVTQGSVRLGNEGKPVQFVPTGGSFVDPAGAHHIITESASATEPARRSGSAMPTASTY